MKKLLSALPWICAVCVLDWDWQMVKAAITGGVIVLWFLTIGKQFWRKSASVTEAAEVVGH